MLIATSLAAAALLSAPALASRPLVPAIVADVTVGPNIPPSLVRRMLEETSAVWQLAGLVLVWQRRTETINAAGTAQPAAHAAAAPSGSALLPASLRITIGDARQSPARDPTVKALGWIVFEADAPQQEIYVSYATAVELFVQSELVVGRVAAMTVTERETLMARAMGRALAHEVGHYLLRSKAHSVNGLMRATFTAAELFSSQRRGLRLAPEQQKVIATRLTGLPPIAYARSDSQE
jgi:hypothetical protein